MFLPLCRDVELEDYEQPGVVLSKTCYWDRLPLYMPSRFCDWCNRWFSYKLSDENADLRSYMHGQAYIGADQREGDPDPPPEYRGIVLGRDRKAGSLERDRRRDTTSPSEYRGVALERGREAGLLEDDDGIGGSSSVDGNGAVHDTDREEEVVESESESSDWGVGGYKDGIKMQDWDGGGGDVGGEEDTFPLFLYTDSNLKDQEFEHEGAGRYVPE